MAALRFPFVSVLLASSMVLASCATEAPVISAESLGVAEVEPQEPPFCANSTFTVDTIARGLQTPWDVAFLEDGTAFVTERAGRIIRFPADARGGEPWLEVDVYSPSGSEIGLMGVEVSPDGRSLYFSATESASSNPLARIGRRVARMLNPERGHQINLTVFRVPISGAAGSIDRVIEPVPAGFIHGGGALRFATDGSLYLTNGDGGDHWRSQLPASFRGKLFNFSPTSADEHPLSLDEEHFVASGIRHSQGLAWTGSGHLLAIDHGPTGLDSEANRTDHDELNVMEPGDNLGWPIAAGATRGGPLKSPLVEWTPALAPAGLAWFEGAESPWDSSVFVTGLRGTRLARLHLSDEPAAVEVLCQENLLETDYGRLRLVRQAPDGSLWVGTSNRDGRGVPRDMDDLILRLRPVSPS